MTATHPTRGVDAAAAATIDAAARYITQRLVHHRLLETTDPHGWDLARRLAVLAVGGDTAAWVAATLPQPRPRPPTPNLVRLFPHGGDTAPR
jgi:hypothetical protein